MDMVIIVLVLVFVGGFTSVIAGTAIYAGLGPALIIAGVIALLSLVLFAMLNP